MGIGTLQKKSEKIWNWNLCEIGEISGWTIFTDGPQPHPGDVTHALVTALGVPAEAAGGLPGGLPAGSGTVLPSPAPCALSGSSHTLLTGAAPCSPGGSTHTLLTGPAPCGRGLITHTLHTRAAPCGLGSLHYHWSHHAHPVP